MCSVGTGPRSSATTGARPSPGLWPGSPDRLAKLVVASVGHPLAGTAAGLPNGSAPCNAVVLVPGMAEHVSPEDDWAFFRRWVWDGIRLGQDPDLDRAGRRPVRPGALVAGLTWYRANTDPARFVINNPTRVPVPAVAVPRWTVWFSDDFPSPRRRRPAQDGLSPDPHATSAWTASTTGCPCTPPNASMNCSSISSASSSARWALRQWGPR
jgi:hypothetical protein